MILPDSCDDTDAEDDADDVRMLSLMGEGYDDRGIKILL
jgi:hypothetical protein